MNENETSAELPESASPKGLCLLLFLSFLITIIFFEDNKESRIHSELLMLILISILTLAFLIFQKLSPQENQEIKIIGSGDILRSATKTAGIFFIFITISFLYKTIPEYQKDFYDSFFYAFNLLKYPILIATPIYIYYTDAKLRDPYDGLWHLGKAVTFRGENVDTEKIKQLLLSWLVKVFFLPLMFSFSCKSIERILSIQDQQTSLYESFESALLYIFLTDTVFACLGYILTLKIYDTHIKKTDPTMTGWVFAIICYQPFWSMFEDNYLTYNSDNYIWKDWLVNDVSIFLWGSLILTLLIIYTISTIAFGVRFSNLTNRGIITIGPYRWTKHPAYITKNISWWLISVPFLVTDNLQTTITHCIMLLAVNGIYYMRAKSEEKMLMEDPIYRQYAAWIAKNGLFAQLNKFSKRISSLAS